MAQSQVDPLLDAARTLDDLGIDQEQPVDVLAAVGRLGLDLAFVPLGGLLGAIVPHGGGGMLVTTQRGAGVQRYTAAHEIGHWVMHHRRLALDGPAEILGTAPNEREAQAQLFAAYFLMPPPLLWDALDRLGLRKGEITPGDAYRLSRDLRVSYEAAVRRLYAHKWIDARGVRGLLAVQRLRALAQATQGARPDRGTAELWQTDLSESGQTLVATLDDEVLIELPENRTTPFRWLTAVELAARTGSVRDRPRPAGDAESSAAPETSDVGPASAAEAAAALELVPPAADVPAIVRTGLPAAAGGVALVADSYRPVVPEEPPGAALARARRERTRRDGTSAPVRTGGGGARRLQLRLVDEGDANVGLAYAHAYDPGQPPVATWRLNVQVRPALHAAHRRALIAATDVDERFPGDPDDDEVFAVAAP
jgi:Zn-dependent peptidase ImmA (M78 family)